MLKIDAKWLVCPYCGVGKVQAQIEEKWEGYGNAEQVVTRLTGFYCGLASCGASWNADCRPILGPRAELRNESSVDPY